MTRARIQAARRENVSLRSEGLNATHEQTLKAVFTRHSRQGGVVAGQFPAYVSTHHIWLSVPEDVRLQRGAYGSRLQKLYAMGYLEKIAVAKPAAAITTKGWAFLVALGVLTEDDYKTRSRNANNTPNIVLFDKLLKSFRAYLNLKKVADGLEPSLTQQTLDELTTPSALLENIPHSGEPSVGVAFRGSGAVIDLDTPDEPLSAEELEGILISRAKDPTQVQLARTSVINAWSKMRNADPAIQVEHDVRSYLSDLEVLKADLAIMHEGPDNYWRREVIVRKSGDGGFTPTTLADLAPSPERFGFSNDVGRRGRGHGMDRIAAALEMLDMTKKGLDMGLTGEHTLGDVAARLERDSISSVGESPSIADGYRVEGEPEPEAVPVEEGTGIRFYEDAVVVHMDRKYESPTPLFLSFQGVKVSLTGKVGYDDAQMDREELATFAVEFRDFVMDAVNHQFTRYSHERVIRALKGTMQYYANPQTWAEADVGDGMAVEARRCLNHVEKLQRGELAPHYKNGGASDYEPPAPAKDTSLDPSLERVTPASLYEVHERVGSIEFTKRWMTGGWGPFIAGVGCGLLAATGLLFASAAFLNAH